MIKFLDAAFIRGQHFTAGMVGDFDAPTEAALIAQGDAEALSAASQPVEVLGVSGVAVACTLSAVDEVLGSCVIPDGVLGPNSVMQIEPLWTYPNSANNKLLKVRIAGVNIYSVTRTTSVREAPLIVLANRGAMTSQIMPYDNAYLTASAVPPTTLAVDLTGNVTIEILGQRASASESLKLEYFRALHFAS